jgi:spore maturation protein CgeB
MWEGLIPSRYVEGEHVPNRELHRFYSSADVVLNDHWPSMKASGFVSNRIFDAGACGACIVSDEAEGLAELFDDSVATYDGSPGDLLRQVEALLEDPERRAGMGARLREIVIGEHTFRHRAQEILRVTEALHQARCRGLAEAISPHAAAATSGQQAAEAAGPAGSGEWAR